MRALPVTALAVILLAGCDTKRTVSSVCTDLVSAGQKEVSRATPCEASIGRVTPLVSSKSECTSLLKACNDSTDLAQLDGYASCYDNLRTCDASDAGIFLQDQSSCVGEWFESLSNSCLLGISGVDGGT